jgi:CDGSH-type Zn-finger protein
MGKIKVIKNGPYHVLGNLPLNELIITPTENGNIYKEGRNFNHGDNYYLCRCGQSKNMPFCDGSHTHNGFDGTTTALKLPLSLQAKKYYGKNLILEDAESLCAFARFCHGSNTDVWNMTEYAENPREEAIAVKLACDCPAGRLVIYDKKTGEAIEPVYEESMSILKDPSRNCDGPIWVKGNVEIIDENDIPLEKRNRVTLCKCGKSNNKPYCDATHVSIPLSDSSER